MKWSPIAYRFPASFEGYNDYLKAFRSEYEELSTYITGGFEYNITPLSEENFYRVDRPMSAASYKDKFLLYVLDRIETAQRDIDIHISRVKIPKMVDYKLPKSEDFRIRQFNDYIVMAEVLNHIYEVLTENKLIHIATLTKLCTSKLIDVFRDPARLLEARCYIYECKYIYSQTIKN